MTTYNQLPDGSGFSIASLPLPKDHWLLRPRTEEWDDERDEPADLPHPILTRELAPQVMDALKYAIRAATMCGKEMDFDPDALALDAVYALCGPVNRRVYRDKD